MADRSKDDDSRYRTGIMTALKGNILMPRPQFAIAILVVLTGLMAGCRNGKFCGPNNMGCANSTLPAPKTGTLNIPSMAKGQSYYSPNGVPTTAQQPSYMVNPNSMAPVPTTVAPVTPSPTLAPQQGWQTVNGTNTSLPNAMLPADPTLAPQAQPAGFATPMNSGPVTPPINYPTTPVYEGVDETRLPATDASNVRAPTGAPGAQPYPIYGTAAPGQPVYSAPPPSSPQPNGQTTFVAPSPYPPQSQPTISTGTVNYGNGVVINTPPATYAVQGSANATPVVLAQSTTANSSPGTLTYDSGWQDRGTSTQR